MPKICSAGGTTLNIWPFPRKAKGLPLEWIPKSTQDSGFNRRAEKMKISNKANAFLSLVSVLILFTTSILGPIQGDYIMTE